MNHIGLENCDIKDATTIEFELLMKNNKAEVRDFEEKNETLSSMYVCV